MTIRRQPADFVVREVLTPAFLAGIAPSRTDQRPWAVYRVTKTSLTTPEAAQRLGKVLGATVSHAGLKDKHALTVQHLSARISAQTAPATCEGQGWSAVLAGWSPVAAEADAIERNEFEIVVRDLSPRAAADMVERAAMLREGDSLRVINYFGDQRFGSARHGRGFAGRCLASGDFEGALRLLIGTPARKDTGQRRAFTRACAERWGDWTHLATSLPGCPERRAIETLAAGGDARSAFAALPYFLQQLSVEAYQSYLWNAVAARLATEADPDAVRADDYFGGMAFPRAGVLPGRLRDAALPMLSSATVLPEWCRAPALDVLASEGLRLEDLRVPGLRRPAFDDFTRPLVVGASRFWLGPPEPDEHARPGRVRVRALFALPRGAYATVVLRALGQ